MVVVSYHIRHRPAVCQRPAVSAFHAAVACRPSISDWRLHKLSQPRQFSWFCSVGPATAACQMCVVHSDVVLADLCCPQVVWYQQATVVFSAGSCLFGTLWPLCFLWPPFLLHWVPLAPGLDATGRPGATDAVRDELPCRAGLALVATSLEVLQCLLYFDRRG